MNNLFKNFKARMGLTAAIFVALAFIFPQDSFSQVRRMESPVKALEYSLKSLYASAREVSKKNKWLKDEIEKMDQEIRFLRGEARSLDTTQISRRIGAVLKNPELMEEMPWEEKRLHMLYEDFIELDEEQTYLEDKLQGKANDQKDIESSIKPLENEVKRLTKQKAQLEEKLDRRIDKSEIGRVKDTLSRSTKSLKYTKRKYKKLERQYGRPLREFNKVQDQNFGLKGRKAYLEQQLNILAQEEDQLIKEIQGITSTDKDKLVSLNEEVADLMAQKRAYSRVLEEAGRKLGDGFKAPDFNPHVSQVKTNIETIKQENRDLKGELRLLEEKILRAENL